MIKLIAGDFTLDAAKGDAPRRTISGTAVPYNVPATVSDGTAVIFRPGSLPVEGKAPRLFMYHDASMPVGVVTERVDTEQGMMFSAKISATSLGNDALVMASDGTIDQVSVGVNPTKFSYDEAGTMIIEAADWTELSLVPIGAFGDAANIVSVAASIHQEPEEVVLNEEVVPEQEIEPMSEVTVPAVEATIPTAPIFAQAKKEFVLPSAGEFMAAYHIGGDTFKNMNAAVAEYSASKKTALQAAAGDVLTTDTPGLLPVPVLGPLVQDLNFLRPVVEAVGARAYPDSGQSKTFVRPTITTHTSVAAQSPELSAVSATTMVIASNSVAKTTLAGQVTLSVQDIDFTSPAAMQLILNDLMGEYMIASDNLAADNLLTAATSSGVWDGTVADLLKSVYDSAVDISNGRNWTPTHMFVSPDVWGQLGQLADTTGRPVFPFIGAGLTGQNALGNAQASSWNGNPLGLQLVVDSNFAAKTMIITRVGQGQGDAYEFYESIRGLMSLENPSTLGRNMSFHGYVSTFAAISGMIRKITQA
ncbi:Prohead protease [uncultured Caudovirales phage]|uniref:Prohead protease n=1 Tax=uncultured Caudovirales phage TaxID=2100421 RepID=A0A6J7X2U1_9CAUD|nr:Prohead protease [uncultured Caudovirales phage]